MITGASRDALQVGFVMEQVLGHVTHYQTLRRVLACDGRIAPHWLEVTYQGNGRLERLPALPPSVRGTLRGFLQVRDGLRRRQLDALLFHTQKPAVFQWDYLARVPTVLSLDVTPAQYDRLGEFYDHEPDSDNAVARLKHWINCRTFALARQIVVWSTWVRASLIDEYGVPGAKVQVIPPGVDLDLWGAPPARTHRQGLPRVLFVGGDFERKGGPLLLKWFRERGRGRCELDLVTRAAIPTEPGVRVHREIHGNSAEARQLFFGADLFALPTLGECFGIASVEAMAASLPVVTTPVGGASDIVQEGETGYLIAPGNALGLAAALDRLLADPGLRQALGRQGRARVESHFDASTNTNKLLHCIRDAIAARNGGVEAQRARLQHGKLADPQQHRLPLRETKWPGRL
jgi:glycosyltransferase involved in cell wall biosynthesis